MMAALNAPLLYTILDNMVLCGLDNVVGNPTNAAYVATNVFADNYDICRNITKLDLDINFDTLAADANNPINYCQRKGATSKHSSSE